ncbi:MAG: hypothetical protein WDZ91_14450 [Paenibacillaceae bacterium]
MSKNSRIDALISVKEIGASVKQTPEVTSPISSLDRSPIVYNGPGTGIHLNAMRTFLVILKVE